MNKHTQGVKPPKNVPLGPQMKRPRESYLQHPEFTDRFATAMEGVETPKDKIPTWMREGLTNCLLMLPFPALTVPMHVYEEICTINCESMSFGVLQKSADIILSSKPDCNWNMSSSSTSGSILAWHLERVKEMAILLDAMSSITDPIRDKVIDDLMAKDSIIK